MDLRDTSVEKLPVEILNLQYFCHIFICRRGAGFFHGFKAPKKIGTLVSLEVVNLINATTSTVTKLGKLTRLRMLSIAKLRKKQGRDLCSSLDKLVNLQQLTISSYGVSDIIDLHYPLSSIHTSLQTLTFEERLREFSTMGKFSSSLGHCSSEMEQVKGQCTRHSSRFAQPYERRARPGLRRHRIEVQGRWIQETEGTMYLALYKTETNESGRGCNALS